MRVLATRTKPQSAPSVAAARAPPDVPRLVDVPSAPAPDHDEPGVIGEGARAAEDSVFKEDIEKGADATREWICSDRFRDDLYGVVNVLIHHDWYMSRQLEITGKNWEMKQRKKLIEEGSRTFST